MSMEHIVPVVCILVAAYLASIGADGWGWFLFIALITY